MILRWVGGKSRLAPQIISTFPPHDRYIEPFFGAGWVFFKKPLVKENMINDVNAELVNLYEVIRDEPMELIRLLSLTPKHEGQFDMFANMYWSNREALQRKSKTFRALVYLYLVKFSFNGMTKSYSSSVPPNQYEMFELIWKMHEHLSQAVIFCRDYKEVLHYGTPTSLVYLDPPYAVTVKDDSYYYEYLINEQEHQNLRDILVAAKYKWVLSYDIHPFVDELYKNIPGVILSETSAMFQSSINKHPSLVGDDTYKDKFKREYIITNFPIQEALPLWTQ